MKPAPFQHHRPDSLQEVLELLETHEEAELLAGNQSLGIVMANRLATPDHLIDLNGVDELSFIEISEDAVEIGAMTRHRTIERSDELRRVLPLLPESAEQIAGPVVRNRGTLGGSLGEADPAGNYATALTALDATLHLRSVDDSRTIPVEEFFLAYMFTALRENEVIERVSVPRDDFPTEETGMAYVVMKRAAQTWPTISAAAAVRLADPAAADPVVSDARLALANASDVPLRVPEAESAIEGGPLAEEELSTVAKTVTAAADPEGEMHADRSYKKEVAGVYARRAIERAYERAITSSQ